MADDIFQESFFRFLRAEPAIREDSHLRCYLYRIAFRLMIDKKRRKKLEARSMEVKRSAASRENIYAESPEEKKSFSMDMAKIFQALKPKVRNLLWLAYVEGYGIREIAEITGAKPNTVKTQLFRARKKLAGLLKKKKYLGGDQRF